MDPNILLWSAWKNVIWPSKITEIFLSLSMLVSFPTNLVSRKTIWRGELIDRVKDDVYKFRDLFAEGKRVPWLDDDTMFSLKAKWNNLAFQTRLERVVSKRSKEEAKHTQGSVSSVNVTKKMNLKRRPQMIGVS